MTTTMHSLREGYRALVMGASGSIGQAFVQALQADAHHRVEVGEHPQDRCSEAQRQALLDKVNQILATAKTDGSLEKNSQTWLKQPLPADL